MQLKIGELARRTGSSVRTLHHYDSIGLLSPSTRTAAGARLYGREDFLRLHRIQVLKQLGCSLSDVRAALDDATVDPVDIISRQARFLARQARRAQASSDMLGHLADRIAGQGGAAHVDWLGLMEMMTLYDRHLTQEEVRILRSPRSGAVEQIEAQRSLLVAEVAESMRERLDTDSPRAHALAWRWVRMVIALTSNDAALAGKLKTLHERELRAQDIVGIDPALFQWIGEAIVHARVALFAKYMTSAQVAEVRRRQLANMDAWPRLVALVREQMAAGTPHDAEPMKALAACWQQLFRDSYTGGDKVLEAKVRKAFALEPDLVIGVGVDEALLRYIRDAMAASGSTVPEPCRPPPPSTRSRKKDHEAIR